MPQKMYKIVCRRCGRTFKSYHGNELYCSYPSIYPEDKGRTCKQMRRIESKMKTKQTRANFERKLTTGEYIITERYGCLTKAALMDKFTLYVQNKHNLSSYSDFQRWSTIYSDKVGEDYDEFQRFVGMKIITEPMED